eukprot:2962955-Rhodomonas_salina.4
MLSPRTSRDPNARHELLMRSQHTSRDPHTCHVLVTRVTCSSRVMRLRSPARSTRPPRPSPPRPPHLTRPSSRRADSTCTPPCISVPDIA